MSCDATLLYSIVDSERKTENYRTCSNVSAKMNFSSHKRSKSNSEALVNSRVYDQLRLFVIQKHSMIRTDAPDVI